MKLSVVVPLHNERESLKILISRIYDACNAMRAVFEIVAVDDGSTDASWDELVSLVKEYPCLKLIRFNANAGQTAALDAGIRRSRGEIVVTIDADLENDPNDIPKLLAKLDEGYDVVSGWRQSRWQGNIFRTLPSRCANWLISKITGVELHDYGCTLKCYRRESLKDIRLYGEMHRFIPALAAWKGARIAEIPVSFSPRKYGVTHYGITRIFRVVLDLLLVKFLMKYMTRPIHFFGGVGFLFLATGVLAGFLAVVLKITEIRSFVDTPLPVFSALFVIVGVQFIVMGILAELVMRTYYESQSRDPYGIKEEVNFISDVSPRRQRRLLQTEDLQDEEENSQS